LLTEACMIKRLAVLVVLLAGCDLYWGGQGDDVCNGTTGSGGGAEPAPVRNPDTGQCEYQGGGGWECPPCGPCTGAGYDQGAPISINWPACYGTCDALGEQACLSTAGCHAAYLGPTGAAGGFWGCWDTLPTGGTGSCTGLDALSCINRDDCVSNYADGGPKFGSCAPEPGHACTTSTDCGAGAHCDNIVCGPPPGCGNCPACGACPDVCAGVCVPDNSCAGVDCGVGSHCEQQCYPCDSTTGQPCTLPCEAMCVPDTACVNVDCGAGYTCVESCTNTMTPGTCYPTCVPVVNDPGDCYGAVTCTSAPPACPASTTPGTLNGCYTGYCIPVAECGPRDPGTCTGNVTCLTGEPTCPIGTVAGIKNGCWSGYCIPQNACPPPACELLATEAACTGRADCIPVYVGTDCICTPETGCTCQTLTYARCETGLMPL
jgi:hypothetical protein